jgi:hypothetical protein
MDQTPTLRALFAGKPKIFAEAKLNPDGTLMINNVVPDRGW